MGTQCDVEMTVPGKNLDPESLYYKYVVPAAATSASALAGWSMASLFVQLSDCLCFTAELKTQV